MQTSLPLASPNPAAETRPGKPGWLSAALPDRTFHQTMLAVLTGYCLLHFAVRFCLSPTLGWDDAEQALWSQRLALGYVVRQPPLYTWLLWGLFQIFGKSVLATAVLRYSVLLATFLCLYASACLVFDDRRKIVLTTFSYWLIYLFMFYAHHDLTHTTLLACAIAATFLVFLLLHRRPSLVLYAVAGLVLAFGFYAKYNYLLFPVCLVLAAVTIKEFRPLVLDRRVLVSVAIASLAIAPYTVWICSQDQSLVETGREIVRSQQESPWLAYAQGLGAVTVALVQFTLPFGIVALILFPELFRWRNTQAGSSAAYRLLLTRMMLAGIAIICCVVIVLDATQFKDRWMLPLLMHFPFLLFLGRLREDAPPRRLRVYIGVVGIFVLAAVFARFATDYWEPRTSSKCRRTLPIAGVQAPLAKLQVERGVIIAESDHMAGNLVILFPDATVVGLKSGAPFSKLPDSPRVCVWRGSHDDDGQRVKEYLEQSLGIVLERLIPDGQIEVPFAQHPDRTVEFCYLSVPPAARSAARNTAHDLR